MISFREWSQSLEELEQQRKIDAPEREKKRREWEDFFLQLNLYGTAPLPRHVQQRGEE